MNIRNICDLGEANVHCVRTVGSITCDVSPVFQHGKPHAVVLQLEHSQHHYVIIPLISFCDEHPKRAFSFVETTFLFGTLAYGNHTFEIHIDAARPIIGWAWLSMEVQGKSDAKQI